MGKPSIDITGHRFNRWLVIDEASKPQNSNSTGKFWNCVCDCGTTKIVYGFTLRSGKSKSCGCHKTDVSTERMKKMQLDAHGTPQERFFKRFKIRADGCWQWTSRADKDGYGILSVKDQNIRAHRFSYEHHIGPIPEGMVVCHHCDNPGCVNPEHLFCGTVKDNAQDALQKQRHYVGSKNGRSKLFDADVQDIKDSNLSGPTLAKRYGVTRSTINKIKRGEGWQHLPLDHTKKNP